MAGKTISAYTDAETASRVNHIAKMEHRRPSQIAGMALKFFAYLPPEARAVLWQLEGMGSTADLEEISREITRILLNAQYKAAQRQIMDHMKYENLDNLETEDDILEAAVNLTR
ncbi:hypothetical protein H6G36_27130 [Anabaena minutissima FACHB-250]|nr:hypothetical protein [Anabaena minutissima FACHB-250]